MFNIGLRQKTTKQAVQSSYSNSAIAYKTRAIRQFFIGSDRATVVKAIRLHQPGRVRFQATWWPAWCDQGVEFNPGDEVRVVGIRNITLLVEPV